MQGSRREVDKIMGTDHCAFSFNLHNGFALQDKEGLLKVRMEMGVSLAAVLNLPQDHFNPIGPAGPWAQEAAIRGFEMARRCVGGHVAQVGDVFFHFSHSQESFHHIITLQ